MGYGCVDLRRDAIGIAVLYSDSAALYSNSAAFFSDSAAVFVAYAAECRRGRWGRSRWLVGQHGKGPQRPVQAWWLHRCLCGLCGGPSPTVPVEMLWWWFMDPTRSPVSAASRWRLPRGLPAAGAVLARFPCAFRERGGAVYAYFPPCPPFFPPELCGATSSLLMVRRAFLTEVSSLPSRHEMLMPNPMR